MTIPEFESEIDAINLMLEKRFNLKISLACWVDSGVNCYNLEARSTVCNLDYKTYAGDCVEDCVEMFCKDFGHGHTRLFSDFERIFKIAIWEVNLPTFGSLEELKMKLELLG